MKSCIRTTMLLSLCVAFTLFAGCIRCFLHPIYASSDLVFNENLIGTWRQSGDATTWQFTESKKGHADDSDSDSAAALRTAKEELTVLIPPSEVMELSIRWEVSFGEAAEQILKYAKQAEIDLVVLGTRPRERWSRFFFGSVADKVYQRASCPVLAVPSEELLDEDASEQGVNLRSGVQRNWLSEDQRRLPTIFWSVRSVCGPPTCISIRRRTTSLPSAFASTAGWNTIARWMGIWPSA